MVQAVSRALDLLEALADADELGVTELADRVALQPSTAHRLLGTLVERGFVVKRPQTSGYSLGFKALELSSSVHERTGRLRSLAARHLETIRRLTDDSANLAVLEGRYAAYIDQVAGTRMVRIFTQVGRRVPAHATGSGKAMLAHLDEEEVERLFAGVTLERPTEHTIADLSQLKPALRMIRGRGYAVDHEEQEEGVSCVAAAVFDAGGAACAALSVSGLTSRLLRNDAADLGELVHDQAREFSEALGWRGAAVSTP